MDIFSSLAQTTAVSSLATLKGEFKAIIRVLTYLEVDYSIVGAAALQQHTTNPRNTKDIDILLLQDDYEEVIEELQGAGYNVTVEHDGAQFFIRSEQQGDFSYDFLFATGFDPEHGSIFQSHKGKVLGVPVPIASPIYLAWQLLQSIEGQKGAKRRQHVTDFLALLDEGHFTRIELYNLLSDGRAKSLTKLMQQILEDSEKTASAEPEQTRSWAELQASKKQQASEQIDVETFE